MANWTRVKLFYTLKACHRGERQFGGWKQVTTAISIQSHQLCVFFSRKKKQFEREVNIRSTPFNDDLKTDTPLFFIGIN